MHSFKLHFKFAAFYCLLLSSTSIFAQTLNENYISSLPPEIQADVLKNIADQTDTNPELYRGPKTTVLQLNSQLEQIQLQLQEIENELDLTQNENGFLEEFGSNFFKSFQSSFAPLSLPSLSKDYMVGIGDIFNISLIGQVNSELAGIPVAKDGSITIAQLGKYNISGLSLREASKYIQNKVDQKIVGQEVYITLSDLRDINVLVIGNVEFPGMYTVAANANILSVLDAAGGPSDNGSMRSILLKRDGEMIEEFDLYEVFVNGNFKSSTQLKAGDVILVSPKGPQVAISGGVTRPAIYELKKGNSLGDALHFAGGVSASGVKEKILVERNAANTVSNSYIALEEINSYTLKNGDNIKVDFFQPVNLAQASVELKGEVKNPGIYPIYPMETLSSLIKRAGGYKDTAYPLAGSIYRVGTKKIEKYINDKLYQDMIAFIASSANSSSVSSGSLPLILSEFKNSKPSGRVTANFNLDLIAEDPRLDIKLVDGDVIEVPPYSPEVFILGEVLNGGSKYYKPELDPSDYIELAGGHGRFADLKKIIVISPNGDTFLHSSGMNFLRNTANKGLYPGSIIYVPRQIGKLDGVNYAASIAPIFSSLAISLASLNSINKN
jgi:polysaccharide export outer membrane protein